MHCSAEPAITASAAFSRTRVEPFDPLAKTERPRLKIRRIEFSAARELL
jgi:hypothetical protein